MTDQTTALALLRDAENYLSALHGSVARHDHLAANLGCAGCDLRDRIAAELRRVADETAATETGCWCGHSEDRHWTGATDMTFTDGCHDCRGWNGAHVYGQELPWLPERATAATERQDGAQR